MRIILVVSVIAALYLLSRHSAVHDIDDGLKYMMNSTPAKED